MFTFGVWRFTRARLDLLKGVDKTGSLLKDASEALKWATRRFEAQSKASFVLYSCFGFPLNSFRTFWRMCADFLPMWNMFHAVLLFLFLMCDTVHHAESRSVSIMRSRPITEVTPRVLPNVDSAEGWFFAWDHTLAWLTFTSFPKTWWGHLIWLCIIYQYMDCSIFKFMVLLSSQRSYRSSSRSRSPPLHMRQSDEGELKVYLMGFSHQAIPASAVHTFTHWLKRNLRHYMASVGWTHDATPISIYGSNVRSLMYILSLCWPSHRREMGDTWIFTSTTLRLLCLHPLLWKSRRLSVWHEPSGLSNLVKPSDVRYCIDIVGTLRRVSRAVSLLVSCSKHFGCMQQRPHIQMDCTAAEELTYTCTSSEDSADEDWLHRYLLSSSPLKASAFRVP